MDFEDMEEKIVKNKIHAAVFCSPHNPTGRVWERWEIEKAMEIYKKYDVTVISDEIWSDIILYENEHIPTQSVSEDARNRTVAFIRTVKDLQPCRTDRKLSYYIQQTPERQSVKRVLTLPLQFNECVVNACTDGCVYTGRTGMGRRAL